MRWGGVVATLTVPPRRPGEVARVVVTGSGTDTSFRNERGEPAAEGRTDTVEVACAAGRVSTGTSYAIYDAAPGTWGHGGTICSCGRRPRSPPSTCEACLH